ncbi:hypothetical protein [Alteriqipengyuania lutimaris]|nr:hypothetical protein [Alteriqipengyuania lutimaris]MBB3034542.1 hypothetical protein [Alteriqipengyuania lutimaris]
MIRVKIPALDRLGRALERRARRLARRRAESGHPWRTPTKLWPHFGDD